MTATQSVLNRYQATFILDSREWKDEMEALFARIQNALTTIGCTDISFTNHGQRNFVRVTDRTHPADVYLVYKFQGASEVPAAIREKFRLDRTVNRVMVTRI